MKKTLIVILICVTTLYSSKVAAQTTKEEEKAAQKEIDEMTDEEKAMMIKMGIKLPTNANSVMSDKVKKTMNNAEYAKQMADYKEWDGKNNKDLFASKKSATSAATNTNNISLLLNSYYNKLYASFRPNVKNEFNALLLASKGNSNNMSSYGVSSWVIKNATIGLALNLKAAIVDGTNIAAINNSAAILTSLGAEDKALTILNALRNSCNDNSTWQNNMGWAWFGLGEVDSARQYFLQAVRRSPNHPQANCGAGLIEQQKGDPVKASQYMQVFLNNACTDAESSSLSKNGGVKHISKEEVLKRYPYKFFLGGKMYQLPSFCLDGLKAQESNNEIKSITDAIAIEIEKIKAETFEHGTSSNETRDNLIKDIEKYNGNVMAMMQSKTIQNKYAKSVVTHPFFYVADEMIKFTEEDYKQHTIQETEAFTKMFEAYAEKCLTVAKEINKLEIELGKKAKPIGGGAYANSSEDIQAHCNAVTAIQNRLLQDKQSMFETYQDISEERFRNYINDVAYWRTFLPGTNSEYQIALNQFKLAYLSMMSNFISMRGGTMDKICVSPPTILKAQKPIKKLNEFKEQNLENLNWELDLILLKFKATNEGWEKSGFEIEADFEAVKLHVKIDDDLTPVTGSSSVTVGVIGGRSIEKGNIKLLEITAESGFTFTSSQKGIDVGVYNNAKIAAGFTAGHYGLPDVGASKDILTVNTSLTINNGPKWASGGPVSNSIKTKLGL